MFSYLSLSIPQHVAVTENTLSWINKDKTIAAQPAFAHFSNCANSFIYLSCWRDREMSSAETRGAFVSRRDGCHFEKSFSVKCQLLTPEVKLNICISVLFPLRLQGRAKNKTKQRAATLQANRPTLIVSASRRKCPQISVLSALFCLYNPLCTTWLRSIPVASSSPSPREPCRQRQCLLIALNIVNCPSFGEVIACWDTRPGRGLASVGCR